jgi:pyruvate,orthophosphate dikinase
VAVHERNGRRPKLEIMIPLVGYERELELVKGRVVAVAKEEGLTVGPDFDVGTMIELPRACFIADQIARHADFFSFGTNDLTQCGIGFSRDDIEGRIIPRYVEEKIVDGSPFSTIDVAGVGELVHTAVERGRRQRPDLKLGVCGEHGGDPESIRFFHDSGIDYVSCSPFRLPIARVAAAQAAIAAPR